MHSRVSGICELIELHRTGNLGGDFDCAGDRVVHQNARRQHDLGAKEAQQRDALGRHRFGHRQDEPIAARGGDKGEADAGVSSGRFDDRRARL